MKVGLFLDGTWGLNLIKLLIKDNNYIIDFVVLRQKINFKILKLFKKKILIALILKTLIQKKV